MKLRITKRFQKDLEKANSLVKPSLLRVLDNMEGINDLSQLKNLKKIKGYNHCYRIKIGNYRLGFRYSENVLSLERFMHRKDIYKYFP